MATKATINRRGEEQEAKELAAQTSKTLKEGERLLAPTRRPDGTLRKPVRIRAGYVPQDEVAVYKSKGSQLKEVNELLEAVPPGYNPEDFVVNKPKSKSAKRNERKKEKRLQDKTDISSDGDGEQASGPVDSMVSKINEINISGNSTECSATGEHVPDIHKKIRALKKKIRLTEGQLEKLGQDLRQEQVEKVAKLEHWQKELKLLEDKKASMDHKSL